MNRALGYAAKSTDPSAQLWKAERRKRYDGIPVRPIEAVCVYDHAFDDFTLRTSGVAWPNVKMRDFFGICHFRKRSISHILSSAGNESDRSHDAVGLEQLGRSASWRNTG